MSVKKNKQQQQHITVKKKFSDIKKEKRMLLIDFDLESAYDFQFLSSPCFDPDTSKRCQISR